VLESLGSKNVWQWAACGKHPLAKDYFTLGRNDALLKVFANWVEEGYRNLSGRKELRSCQCSWRFWARQKGGALVCGLIRDSSDKIGRPYPLLVLGSGVVENWEKHWDLLPFACERTWNQMEYFASGIPRDIKYLEDELRRIREPSSQWDEFFVQRERLALPASHDGSQKVQKELRNLGRDKSELVESSEFRLDLTQHSAGDPWVTVIFWHFVLKENSNSIPNAVFMGGGVNRSFLNVFRRPMAPADLVRLWDVG